MPLKRDERGGGTNADGSTSEAYCSHCYDRGHFVMPDITVQGMQARVGEKLTRAGLPRLVVAMLTRRIPRLKRWRGES
jgi:hypothetical protein